MRLDGAGDAQDRHGALRGRDRLDRDRRAARPRGVAPGDGALLRGSRRVRRAPRRHGGEVHRRRGDGGLRRAGRPRGRRAACRPRRPELRDSLTSLNDELEREYGVSLQLRTGVNTGEVVTGTEERLATGDAVNVAARLEQARAARRDPDRRADAGGSPAARSSRAGRAARAEGEGRARCRLPPARGSSKARRPSSGGSTHRSSGAARSSRGCVRRSAKPSRTGGAASSPCSARRDRQVAACA